jgi:hypothetical protein
MLINYSRLYNWGSLGTVIIECIEDIGVVHYNVKITSLMVVFELLTNTAKKEGQADVLSPLSLA